MRFVLNQGNGRVDSARLANATVARYTYDSHGRLRRQTDGLDHMILERWHAGTNGNTSKDSVPGGRITTYGYDSYGRPTSLTPPGGPTRTTNYDLINRVTASYDGVNPNPTVYSHDALHTFQVIDPFNNTYWFTYDATGALTTRTDPAGHVEHFKYGRNREPVRYTNRRGETATYAYDQLLRLIAKGGGHLDSTAFSYSPGGDVVTGWTAITTETMFLNDRRQPDSLKTTFAGSSAVYWRRYTYTPEGAIGTVKGTGSTVTFQDRIHSYWLQQGTLSGITFGGAQTTFTRNADRQVTTVTLPGTGHTIGHEFNTIHRSARDYSDAMDLRYHTDTRGLVSTRADWPNGTLQAFGYDGLSRLTRTAFRSGISCQFYQEFGYYCSFTTVDSTHTFSYDAIGNRLDQNATYDGNRLTGFAGCTYSSDNDGNVTSRTCPGETVTFTWDAESKLKTVVRNGNTTELHYNALGALAYIVDGGTPVRYFLWDRGNLFAEINVPDGVVLADYMYYPGLDRPHAVRLWQPGGSYVTVYAHTDMLGNVVGVTDVNRAVKRSYVYDEWGQLVGGSDALAYSGAQRARWKGALWIGAGADLYYMRSRWYEPKTGRFLSEDPIGLAGGINQYMFVGSNPIGGRDPLGLSGSGDCPEKMVPDPNDPEKCIWGPVEVEPIVTVGGVPWWAERDDSWWFDDGFGSLGERIYRSLGGSGDYRRVLREHRAATPCGAVAANFVLTAVGDAFFFTGASAGVSAARYSRYAGSYATNPVRFPIASNQGRAMAILEVGPAAAARDAFYMDAVHGYTQGRLSQFLNAEGTGSFSYWGLVPGIATAFALYDLVTC